MRIGFITPHVLFDWNRTYSVNRDHAMMLGAAPELAGFLHQFGYRETRQYDHRWIRSHAGDPTSLDLDICADAEEAARFFDTRDSMARAAVERFVDAVGFEEADLFTLSCGHAYYNDPTIEGYLRAATCLATVLKERFPGCRIALGGFSVFAPEVIEGRYRLVLDEHDCFDFAAIGPGEVSLLNICDEISGVSTFETSGQPFEVRRHGRLLFPARLSPDRAPAGLDATTGNVHVRSSGARTSVARSVGGKTERMMVCTDDSQFFYHEWIFDPLQLKPWTGSRLMDVYHFDASDRERMAPHAEREVLVLPFRFIDGCNNRCAFCSHSGTPVTSIEPAMAVRFLGRIAEKTGTRSFVFYNTHINWHRDYATKFCDELAAARLEITWSDSLNLSILDERLMDRLVACGFIRAAVGVEGATNRLLHYIHKPVGTVEKVIERLRQLHERGIYLYVQLISGLPTETEEDRQQVDWFIEQTAGYADLYNVSPFRLEPLSPLATYPGRYGIEVLPEDSCNYYLAFRELQGRNWSGMQAASRESTRRMTEAIARVKGHERFGNSGLNLHLLYWLYESLGRGAKDEICALMNRAHLEPPPVADLAVPVEVASPFVSPLAGSVVDIATNDPEPDADRNVVQESEPVRVPRDGGGAGHDTSSPQPILDRQMARLAARLVRADPVLGEYRIARIRTEERDRFDLILVSRSDTITLILGKVGPGQPSGGDGCNVSVCFHASTPLDRPARRAAALQLARLVASWSGR